MKLIHYALKKYYYNCNTQVRFISRAFSCAKLVDTFLNSRYFINFLSIEIQRDRFIFLESYRRPQIIFNQEKLRLPDATDTDIIKLLRSATATFGIKLSSFTINSNISNGVLLGFNNSDTATNSSAISITSTSALVTIAVFRQQSLLKIRAIFHNTIFCRIFKINYVIRKL